MMSCGKLQLVEHLGKVISTPVTTRVDPDVKTFAVVSWSVNEETMALVDSLNPFCSIAL
jgi:predicted LPLAT superfamily acyltransferase